MVTKYTREKINRDFNQILKGSLSEDLNLQIY